MKSSLFNHSPLRIKGKQTFQIVPRAKDSSTGVKGNIKEKILNKALLTIELPFLAMVLIFLVHSQKSM